MNPDYQIKNVKCYNIDCMAFMKTIPDNFYELAIVDPPYGIGIAGQKESKKGKKSDRKGHTMKNWDDAIPDGNYFSELFRISQHQIIWGGNYFVEHLIEGHKGWIVWDKGQRGLTMSDCELAYSSFDKATRIIELNRVALRIEGTIHPTQKPKQIYSRLLNDYAKHGFKIIDTHGGSFSSACACLDMGFDLDICEIDKEYFTNAVERLKNNVQDYFEFA